MAKNTEKVRASLEAKLESLQERLAEMNDTLRQPEDDDFEEQAVELDDDEVLARLAQAGRLEEQLIHAALERIEAGTYGTCVMCGKAIEKRRLQALPETGTCLSCARAATER